MSLCEWKTMAIKKSSVYVNFSVVTILLFSIVSLYTMEHNEEQELPITKGDTRKRTVENVKQEDAQRREKRTQRIAERTQIRAAQRLNELLFLVNDTNPEPSLFK